MSERTMGQSKEFLLYPVPLFGKLLSDLTDTLQVPPMLESGCFLSFSFLRILPGLEPQLLVSAFLSFLSHSFPFS